MNDVHLAVIFYTGDDQLSRQELMTISAFGNIYIQQNRPESLPGTIESIILEFENHWYDNHDAALTIDDIDAKEKAAWCVLYCGGSSKLETDLKFFSRSNGFGFQSELFDW